MNVLKKIESKIIKKMHQLLEDEASIFNFKVNHDFNDNDKNDKKYESELYIINKIAKDNPNKYFFVKVYTTAHTSHILSLNEENEEETMKNIWYDIDWSISYQNLYDDGYYFHYETEEGKQDFSELLEIMIEEEGENLQAIRELLKLLRTKI